jgi:hypothetical protein
VQYRRIGATEVVKLTPTLRSVDLEVGGSDAPGNSQVTAQKGVDLKRVGGAHNPLSTPSVLSGQVMLRAA